ncbi:MAG: glycosyltransferase family 4 protein [Candidatus Tectomicrobia bacterium]|uniref:Glycosyltransferase family 4 protein n=1 Tax=Tectimicrobiota bacterium TaxID=2528274 RepID=A0A932GQL7_UNCTE|nr:glycosyltransferase family 4 protein [Candidatus Tectomicrobia bacterium]
MRVVLSTISKFHTFDLARQLERRGVLERLFTGRPRWKLRGETLPLHKVKTFPYLQTIFEAMGRAGIERYPFRTELNWFCHQTLDGYVARLLPDCEVFHALSYCGLRSGVEARRRGARWVCDVVNSHPVFQDEILAEEYRRVGLSRRREDSRFLDYAAASYEQADMITVLSTFAQSTFLAKGVPAGKLAVIPYGVDLTRFHPVDTPQDRTFRVLFVGQLSVRKGVHDLIDAFRMAALPGSRLVLVGSVLRESETLLRRAHGLAVDVLGPRSKQELSHYYSQADVMVLPSIEDGFGSVIGEALACGSPVIATTHTGGADFFTDGVEGFIVPVRSPEAIAAKLVWLYEHRGEREAMRKAALERVRKIGGWDEYGARIVSLFRRLSDAA